MIGKTILHYKILEKLGEGGMGVVYKATDSRLERDIAIKFLPRYIAGNKDERKRFEIEAKAAAALNHPNISHIYAIEETENEMFIVMELIEGIELKDKIKTGSVSSDEVINIAIQILEGLEAAHKKGIVHRDIKSSNIMISNDGKVKIMDFGLAKIKGGSELTKGLTVGTAAYMSPEQTQGDDVDSRTDIWSFGVVLFEMLTGKMPFNGDYDQAIIYSILNEEPSLVKKTGKIIGEMNSIIRKCLQKNKEERFQSVEEINHSLKTIRKPQKVEVRKSEYKKDNHFLYKRRKKIIVLAFLVLLITIIILLLVFPAKISHAGSIAVLPFKNLNGDPEQEYFSEGMTETIISNLANITGLTVISRTSVMSYKASQKTIREIGRELNVSHILEGSVITSGNKVRIFVQLIDAESDETLWAYSYDQEMTDIFSIQSTVANQVVEVLEVTLATDAQERINERPTKDIEAYRLYLKGLYYVNKSSFANVDTAISFFQQAIDQDANFALAYAVLSGTYTYYNVEQNPHPDWEEKAYVTFQQALSLDPNLAEAYVARGNWYWTPSNNFKHEIAIKDFKKAIELKPGLSSAYQFLAMVQLHVGLLDKALQTGRKALELEPTSMWAQHFLGEVLFFEGKYSDALNMFKNINYQFIPFFRISFISQTLYHLGQIKEANEMIKKGLLEYPSEPLLNSSYAIILAGLGRLEEANERMELALENKKELRHVHHLYYNLACASALMGKNKEAVRWLIMASNTGLPCYPLFSSDPNLENLKDFPEYEDFIQKLKKKWDYFKTL